jgi:integrase
MAEIISRGEGKWLVRVFVSRVHGKTKYHNKVIHGTKKDAQKYARQAETKRDLGTLDKPAADDPTLKTFLADWMVQFKKGSVTERTYDGYEYQIKQYVNPYLGKLRLSELTARKIQDAYNELHEQGYSPRTISFSHGLIRDALNQAVVDDLLEFNPSLSTRRPPKKKKPIKVFTPEQAEAFMKSAKKDPLGVVFWFALAVGLRPEEYLALQWPELDLDKQQVTVRQTIYFKKGGGWQFEDVKTDSGLRTVRFDKRLAQALAVHKRNQAQRRFQLGKKYQNNNLVFAAPKGTPLQMRNLTLRHLVPILERAKIDGPMNLYRLRHSFVTLSLMLGIDAKQVSRAAGHASVAFTQDNYQHALPSVEKDAAERIGKLLFGAV